MLLRLTNSAAYWKMGQSLGKFDITHLVLASGRSKKIVTSWSLMYLNLLNIQHLEFLYELLTLCYAL